MQKVNNYINKKNINTVLLIIFTFNCIFIPYDTFELKIISFFFLLLFNVKDIFKIEKKDEVIIFLFGFLLTSINILKSILLTHGNIYQNIQLGYVPYILMLYPIIKKNQIQYEKMFISFLKYLAYIIVIAVVLDVLNIVPLYSNPLMLWYHNSKNAMIGKGTNFAIGYMMFIKTTPMLIMALPSLINDKKIFSCIVVCLALVLSGTRANMIMGVIVFFLCISYYIYKNYSMSFFKKYCIVISICMLIILIRGEVVNFVVQMFINKSNNDVIRNGILNSIINTWRINPVSFFIGAGFSSQFFNIARSKFETIVELSYWNLLRQTGIISFILIMLMYLLPIYYILKSKKNISYIFAYIGYLGIAYTNPLLFSSTGLVVLLYMYYICFITNKSKMLTYEFDLKDKILHITKHLKGEKL